MTTRIQKSFLSAQGYKSIRIPINWDSHIGEAPNYTIEKAYLDRVEEVVGWTPSFMS